MLETKRVPESLVPSHTKLPSQGRPTKQPFPPPSKLPDRTKIPSQSSWPSFHHPYTGKRSPTGSPLSGTLLMLAFDGIFSVIKYPVTPILFADDLSIHISTNDQQRVDRKLQEIIDLILEWADQFDFRFSHPKTNLISFKKRNTKLLFLHSISNHSLSQQQKPSRSSDSDSTIVTLGYLT